MATVKLCRLAYRTELGSQQYQLAWGPHLAAGMVRSSTPTCEGSCQLLLCQLLSQIPHIDVAVGGVLTVDLIKLQRPRVKILQWQITHMKNNVMMKWAAANQCR
jgi:hypothetical protein